MRPPIPSTVTPVFVIAFVGQQRRKAINRRLVPLGINPRFFDAVQGTALSVPERRPFQVSGREYYFDKPMSDGAMGCSLSHFGIWKTIIDDGLEAAVVLEDDAVVTDTGRSVVVERLNTLHEERERLDLVFLHRRFGRKSIPVDGDRGSGPSLALSCYSDIGTESYFITNRCARYLLARPERYRYEVDLFLQHWWRHDPEISILHHQPALFQEEGRPSQIRSAATPGFESNPLHHRFMRRFHRLSDSLRKRILFRGHVSRNRARFSTQAVSPLSD